MRHERGWAGWLAGQGGWAATVAAHEWSVTPLGPIESWPAELRSAVSLCVNAAIPMAIWWGPDLTVIPNLAARPVFGEERFAAALGRPVSQVWPDALPRIRSEMAELMAGGTAFFDQDSLAPYDRDVAGQETFLSYSYTPISDPQGRVLGVLCIFTETTSQVLARRRADTIAGLGHQLATGHSEAETLTAAVAVLAGNTADHPAAALVAAGTDTNLIITGYGQTEPAPALAAKVAAHAATVHSPCPAGAPDPAGVEGGWHGYLLTPADPTRPALVLVVAHHRQRPFDTGMEQYFALLATLMSGAISTMRGREESRRAREQAQLADLSWRAAVLHSIQDPIVIFDHNGTVVELNQAFTDLFGHSLDHGPLAPPYPWWPTDTEDPDGAAHIRALHDSLLADPRPVDAEVRFYTTDRRPIWVHTRGSYLHTGDTTLHIRSLRDITRDRAAQQRRSAAVGLATELGTADDLATLLSIAEHAFDLLFEGTTTLQVDLDTTRYLHGGASLTAADLAPQVTAGLAGDPDPDTRQLRPGILLTATAGTGTSRAWIQFPRPRRITADEMSIADLLAHAFALAVDRLVLTDQAADRETHLRQALESHQHIGQAIGILVERHRILPGAAFDRLKTASQNRNLKLRELARRVIETGAEPEQA
jgi:PAS domain S-box-containing protein